MNSVTFDGFFFTPSLEDDEVELSFFDFNEEKYKNAEPVDKTPVGLTYHIVFFKPAGDGTVEFDESFEAVFADPVTYVKNLAGSNLFGCVLKKTTHSKKWFDNYLTNAKKKVTIHNMKVKEGL